MADSSIRIDWPLAFAMASGLSGFYGLYEFYQFYLIRSATEVTSADLPSLGTGCFSLSGTIVALSSESVIFSQAQQHPEDYPRVIYSSLSESRYNQFCLNTHPHLPEPPVLFTQQPFFIEDCSGRALLHPNEATEVWGLEVYRQSETASLSAWNIFKIVLSSVLIATMKFLGPIVIVRRDIREAVLPEGASVDAVVRTTRGPSALRIEPLFLGLSRVHMEQDCKAKAILFLSLSIGFGVALAAVKLYKTYRSQALNRKYARMRNAVSEEWLCSLCMYNPRDLVLFPCHHVCLCQVCSEEVVNCPICRRRIDKRVPILMASK